eukprot:Protomagalhaensia_sp_Gyna_25__2432@NODE_2353_length_1134_cov_2_528767_g1949_i0_p1_GENE_NODE_2353_length_1134_cov_2_528767_g1949_i0NODE_2353_length_1134_cov_2_528767_g1949_i0_p1_ORF_typecomplete_len123_score18_82acVLRF1/PF18859_1/0_0082_NODE_2353_length_1134_cov_2_528767_g1949_i0605973
MLNTRAMQKERALRNNSILGSSALRSTRHGSHSQDRMRVLREDAWDANLHRIEKEDDTVTLKRLLDEVEGEHKPAVLARIFTNLNKFSSSTSRGIDKAILTTTLEYFICGPNEVSEAGLPSN